MQASQSPIATPLPALSERRVTRTVSPGLSYAQALRSLCPTPNEDATGDPAAPVIDIQATNLSNMERGKNQRVLHIDVVNRTAAFSDTEADHTLVDDSADWTGHPNHESPTTQSIIDVDALDSDDDSVILVTTPIKQEESPVELGKRFRFGSPTPSMFTASTTRRRRCPKKGRKGRKAARKTLSDLDNDILELPVVIEQPAPRYPSPPSQTPSHRSRHPSIPFHPFERPLVESPFLDLPGNDVDMQSPSPTISMMMRSRIPGGEKGKGRYEPTPGPSNPSRIFDAFLNPSPAASTYPAIQIPKSPIPVANDRMNESACSIYPPIPPQYRAEFPFRTPVPAPHLGHQNFLNGREGAQGTQDRPQLTSLGDQPRRAFSPQFPKDPPQLTPKEREDALLRDDPEYRSALRHYVQQQTENAPAELDDFLRLTPMPPGGFPKIHHSSPLALYENIDDLQLLDWEREQALGLVAVGMSFWGHGALDGDVDPRYKQLLSYATHILNARFHTDRIMIAKPRPKTKVHQLNAAPYTTLVHGLYLDEVKTLCEEGVMSTPKLGLFFHSLDVTFPSYIGAIHGLTTRLIHPVYEMVIAHFLTPEAERLFRSLAETARATSVNPEDAQSHHVASLYVRRLDCRAKGNTLAPVFLMYIKSPATDYYSHRVWTAFCKKINLSHSLYGTGSLKSPGTCAGCHGHDHPTGLCRFPTVPDWLAPEPYHTPDFAIPALPSMLHAQQSRSNSSRRGRGNFGNTDQRGRRRRQGREVSENHI